MKHTAKAISSLIFGVVVLMCACQGRTQERLEQVDSLLSQDNVDAAYMYLNALPSIEEENKGDVAYHTLLKTEILYRTGRSIVNDSIDYSIFYYEQNGLSDKLARAYYYKGVIQCFIRNDSKAGITLLKKAEAIAEGLSDLALQHKIDESICYVNLLNKNYATALIYAKRARDLGYKAENKQWIAYSLTYMANAYGGLAETDSNLIYLLKSLQYYRYLSSANQSVLLANISDTYTRKKDFVKAESYIRKALAENPGSYTYAILGDIYMQRGDYAKAQEYLLKAAASQEVYTREKALASLFKLKQMTGDWQGSARLADTLLAFKDEQEEKWRQNNIYEIQNRYDREERERVIHSYRLYTGVLFVIFLLILTVFIFYHKYKAAKTRRNLLEKHLLVNEYSNRLDEMKLSQSVANKELNSLRQRVSKMKDREIEVLSNGKLLYESIMSNGNTLYWSSRDFLDFLEYFKLIDLKFINHLDSKYSNLSPRQYLFLIAVERMEKTDSEVGDILAISAGSVRSIKSRIRSKRIKERIDD